MSDARSPFNCHPAPCVFAAAIDAVTLPFHVLSAGTIVFSNAAAQSADEPTTSVSDVPIDDGCGNSATLRVLTAFAPVPLIAGDACWRSQPMKTRTGCLHEAAFEALPLPVVVHDERRFIAGNECARLLLGGDPAGMAPGALTHPDSADAGRQRRDVALNSGLALHGVRIKMHGLHGRTVAVTVDAIPVDHLAARIVVITAREAC